MVSHVGVGLLIEMEIQKSNHYETRLEKGDIQILQAWDSNNLPI